MGLRRGLVAAGWFAAGWVALSIPAPPAQAHPFGAPPTAELRVEGMAVDLTWSAAQNDLAALAELLGVHSADGAGDDVAALAGAPALDAYLRSHLDVRTSGGGCPVERIDTTDPAAGFHLTWRCSHDVAAIRLRSTMLTDSSPSYRTLVRAVALDPQTAALTGPSPEAAFALPGTAARPRPDLASGSAAPATGIEARVVDAATTVRWSAVVLALLAGLLHGLRPGHGKSVTAGQLLAGRARARATWTVAAAVAVTHSATAAGLALLVWLAGDAATSTRALTERAQLLAATVAVAAGVVLVVRFHRTHARPHDHSHPHEDHSHPHEDHSHPHEHGGQHDARRTTRRAAAVSATVAGLVPSPTAFVACATALYAGRPAWGFFLVGAFGVGLACGVAGLSGVVVAGADAIGRRAGAAAVPRVQRTVQGAGAWLALGGGLVLLASTLGAR